MESAILASEPFATTFTPPGVESKLETISCGRRNLMSMFSRNPTRGGPEPFGRLSTMVNLYGPVGVSWP